jgi:hypothetical protein
MLAGLVYARASFLSVLKEIPRISNAIILECCYGLTQAITSPWLHDFIHFIGCCPAAICHPSWQLNSPLVSRSFNEQSNSDSFIFINLERMIFKFVEFAKSKYLGRIV